MTSDLIEINGLEKIYSVQGGQSIKALSDVNLTIREGEFISVVGPSGCGKSTLLKILAGLLQRSRGTVLLRGTSIDGPRDDIGVVFQDAVLLPWKTIIENTLFPITIQRRKIVDYTQRAKDLLKMVGLAGFEDRYPFELSGGMQQRASITRAIIHDPAILLMDEPFGALDALTRETMNVELQRIWMESRKTIFFITHSIPEAVFLGDHVVLMSPRPGRIASIFEISFPRPRPLEIMGTLDFGEIANEIRAQLAS
jgi:NitT/TauT family transport system ATP-binding protein